MTDQPTPEDVRQSTEADSDQMNAADIVGSPVTITVASVEKLADKKQPWQIHMVERDKPFRPCKTCRRIITALWTDVAPTWIGKKLTLYCDPEVVYGGKKVGGLRISHASGIDKPQTYRLPTSRGKTTDFTIQPIIETVSTDDTATIKQLTGEIQAAETLTVLEAAGFIIKTKSPAVKKALKPVYGKRLKELKAAAQPPENPDAEPPPEAEQFEAANPSGDLFDKGTKQPD